jgi:hypothetical protein
MVSKVVVMLMVVLLVVQSCAASRQVLQHNKEKSPYTSPNSYGGHDDPSMRPDCAGGRASTGPRPPPAVPSSPPPIHVPLELSGLKIAEIIGHHRRQILQHGHSGGASSPTNTVSAGYTYSGGEGKWKAEVSHTEHTGGSQVTVSGHVDSKGNAGASVSKTDTKRP